MQTEENQIKQAIDEARLKAQAEKEAYEQQEQELEEQANAQAQEEETATDDAAETEAQADTQESAFDPKEFMAANEQLKAQVAQLEAKYKTDTEKFIRALAECENQKKRIEADVERERKYGNEKILKALIPVVDSLELALKHSNKEDPAIKPTIEGVENTTTLLLKELKSFGVEPVDPKGQAFDPNLHQAISMAPSVEFEQNIVMDVMQKGYTLNGRVVRPAMVIVSSGAPAGVKTQENPEEKKNTINIEA